MASVQHALIGMELVRARSETLLAEAERDGRARRARGHAPRRGASLRLALGARLVSAGFRLLGEGVEVG
jgi:hypothetical protein